MFFGISEQYLYIEFIHTKLDKSAFLWSTHDMKKYYLLAGAIALAFLGCDAEVVPSPPDLGAVDGGGTSMKDTSPAEVPPETELEFELGWTAFDAGNLSFVELTDNLLPVVRGSQGADMVQVGLRLPAYTGQKVRFSCQISSDVWQDSQTLSLNWKVDFEGCIMPIPLVVDWQDTWSGASALLHCEIIDSGVTVAEQSATVTLIAETQWPGTQTPIWTP